MLLLYMRLFGNAPTREESEEILPNRSTLNQSETDLEQEISTRSRNAKPTEEIRHIRQVYHLERRLLM
ncbi:MAG TPA: hypothetical protein VK211_00530 [Kamptonema sp.]|nr:hypothetical protein [Kamptonema sp.]